MTSFVPDLMGLKDLPDLTRILLPIYSKSKDDSAFIDRVAEQCFPVVEEAKFGDENLEQIGYVLGSVTLPESRDSQTYETSLVFSSSWDRVMDFRVAMNSSDIQLSACTLDEDLDYTVL